MAKTYTFKIYGTKEDLFTGESELTQGVDVAVDQFLISRTRSGGQELEFVADENDVIGIVTEKEHEIFFRPEDYIKYRSIRRGTRSSSNDSSNIIVIEPVIDSGSDNRTKNVLSEIRKITHWKEWAAKNVVVQIASKIENLDLGLHTINDNFEFGRLPSQWSDQKYLLFIHGTASSTKGSFKYLSTENPDLWKKLLAAYPKRILAFEHRTLTESPWENTLKLIQSLPSEIQIDVISHSRGGIIGEILSRMEGGKFFSQDIQKKKISKDFQDDLNMIEKLESVLQEKKIKIDKFIRVACPANGTILLGSRLDCWVNLFFNGLKLIPSISGSVGLSLISDFTKALVHERTQAETLPGLAAMIPESPILRLLNLPDKKLNQQLFTITGDASTRNIFKMIRNFFVDIYFSEANDLVVQCSSTTKGTLRLKSSQFWLHDGEVSHFEYFRNQSSCKAIIGALENDSENHGFKSLEINSKIDLPTSVTRTSKKSNRPAVVLLPGLLSSNLRINGQSIWRDPVSIGKGKILQLGLDKNVEVDGAQAMYYYDIIQFLISKQYHVFTYAYDWRNDILDEAYKFNKYIHSVNNNHPQCHIIAHSTGGLLLATSMSIHPPSQKHVLSSKKNKAIFMGTAFKGMYSTFQILNCKDTITSEICQKDIYNQSEQISDLFSSFPGIIQLLPEDAINRIDKNIWNSGLNVNPPAKNLIKLNHNLYSELKKIDWTQKNLFYIAGSAKQTLSGMILENKKVILKINSNGDGRSLWENIPLEMIRDDRAYFCFSSHMMIPSDHKIFEAVSEILVNGKTNKLSTTAFNSGTTRTTELQKIDATERIIAYPEDEYNSRVKDAGLSARMENPLQKINITLTHGNLIHARHPVMVGHFKGDSILQAEKVLDGQLNGQLTQYYSIGNYAEEVGESIILFNNQSSLLGGLVIGLGNFGTLNEFTLRESIHFALIEYCFKSREKFNATTCKLSTVMICTGYGGLSIQSFLRALFTAVTDVNTKIQEQNQQSGIHHLPSINEIEIIEIHRHKVIQAGRLIHKIRYEKSFQHLDYNNQIKKVSGARNEVPNEFNPDWWHRIKISQQNQLQEKNLGNIAPLVFTSITDKSYAEEKVIPADLDIVESLIKITAIENYFDQKLCSTLFQLLIPTDFKTYLSDERNLILIVDKYSARIPWELLIKPSREEILPIIYNSGMLRQLTTSNYKTQIKYEEGNYALIIADPDTNGKYQSLDHSYSEAESIMQLLGQNDYTITKLIHKKHDEILPEIISGSYQILHIAAHGIYSEEKTGKTGIIIGQNEILTTAVISQMKQVPQLVFINCCELGKIYAEEEIQLQAKYEVAASLGCHFINMGAKGVIVAGWEVNDNASSSFSQEFYQSFISGNTFGDAVKQARRVCYDRHPTTNTWGAYQCYGDPYFALKTKQNPSHKKVLILDVDEAVSYVLSLTGNIRSGKMISDSFKLQIKEDLTQIPEFLQNHPRVLELIAELYSSIGDLENCLRAYEQVFLSEDADYSLKSVEKYYLLSIEHLENQKPYKNKKEFIQACRPFLDKLIGLAKEANTVNRQCLISGIYKRMFIYRPSRDLLELVKKHYYGAFMLMFKKTGEVNYYPYFNYLITVVFLDQKLPEDTGMMSKKALAYSMKEQDESSNLWSKIVSSFPLEIELLLSTKQSSIQKLKVKLLENFISAWKTSGTFYEKSSHLNHLEYLIIASNHLIHQGIQVKQKIEALQWVLEKIKQLD